MLWAMEFIALLRISARYSKNRHPVLYHLLGTLLGAPLTGYYFIIYSYLKWVDDYIDRSDRAFGEAVLFLDRQFSVLLGEIEPDAEGEILGRAIGRLLVRQEHRPLFMALRRILSSFYDDLRRRNQIQSYYELNLRVERIGFGALEICESIFARSGSLSLAFKRDAARLYVFLDMLLDLEEDLELGYINIPAEVFDYYSIPRTRALKGDGVELFRSPGFQRWILENCERLEELSDKLLSAHDQIRSGLLRRVLRKMTRQKQARIEKLRRRWSPSTASVSEVAQGIQGAPGVGV